MISLMKTISTGVTLQEEHEGSLVNAGG